MSWKNTLIFYISLTETISNLAFLREMEKYDKRVFMTISQVFGTL